jgi:peptidoglycan/xylan/chitin deacetylase (PgdA/CDA1 family)
VTAENPYYSWSPIAYRPKLQWPDGARVALGVLLTLENLDWYPPAGARIPSIVQRQRPGVYPAVPDIDSISQPEYGNRVGVFRVLDVLDRHGITPFVAMDVAVAERSPFLVEHLRARGVEFVGHGLSSEQMITEAMTEADERRLIADTLARLSALTGERIRGWHGSEYGESSRTVRLLAEAGLDYVLDWPNDEQPTPMQVPAGELTNVPVAFELDDVFGFVMHVQTPPQLQQLMVDAFDRLYLDGADSGRLLVLNVHPWLTGQPYRIKYLDAALNHMCGHAAVWKATGAEIVDWYRSGAYSGS